MPDEAALHELAAVYALDALDGADFIAFERHYASCVLCRSVVAELRETLAHLATTFCV